MIQVTQDNTTNKNINNDNKNINQEKENLKIDEYIKDKQQQNQNNIILDNNNRSESQNTKNNNNNNNKLIKKKKYRKKHRKLSLEKIQQLKRHKINHIRENAWQNNVNSEFIPSHVLQQRDKLITFRFKKRNNKSPLQQKVISKKNQSKSQHKTVFKQFHIRIIKKPKNSRSNTNSQKNQIQKDFTIDCWKDKIQKICQLEKIPVCHKNILLQLCQYVSSDNIRKILTNQLQLIKNNQSTINIIVKAIQKRKQQIYQLKKIQQNYVKDSTNNKHNSLTSSQVNGYRISSLVCIEQILKWRLKWSKILKLLTKKHNLLKFQFEENDYLLHMNKDIQFLNEFQEIKNDLFLLNCCSIANQDKETILKIRTCQLLLLQEELKTN